MPGPEQLPPINKYLASPQARTKAISHEVRIATATDYSKMDIAAKLASQKVMDDILKAKRNELEDPSNGFNLATTYAIRTLDRLTIHGAESDYKMGDPIARHLSQDLAERLEPDHEAYWATEEGIHHRLMAWLDKVSKFPQNPASFRLQILSQGLALHQVDTIELPLPAWKDPLFTNPRYQKA